MTHTTRTPLRRTTKMLARTLAAGSLAGLAVAAFAAPAQASSVDPDDKIWSAATDGGPFQAPYSVRITGDNREWSASPDPTFTPPYSVRITGDDVENREFSVRITSENVDLDNRDFSVRITGDELDNRDFSVRITAAERIADLQNRDMKLDPDNRDYSVRITSDVTPDNRDY